jgi:hypothetical protein
MHSRKEVSETGEYQRKEMTAYIKDCPATEKARLLNGDNRQLKHHS